MSSADKVQVSLRIPSDVVASFDAIAAALDRDRSWVMLRAMKGYLAGEGAEVLEDADGIAELDRGEHVDFDQMLNKARAIVDAAESLPLRRAR